MDFVYPQVLNGLCLSTGSEGRAGMAAIVDPDYKINLTELCTALQRQLPAYSRPLFIRLLKEAADTTGGVLFGSLTLLVI